jgi:Leucine-rich repeat (LRR) protein
LDLSGNGLQTLHVDALLPGLNRLHCLRLGRNQLETMPQALGLLRNLREVELAFNQIARIELDFMQISHSLEVLDVSSNRVAFLDDTLTNCSRLRIVNLSNNELNEVPFGFGFIESLQSLSLQGCPLRALRQAVINGPIEPLKAALRNKAPVRGNQW